MKKLKAVRDFFLCLLLMVGGFLAVIYIGSLPAYAEEKPEEKWEEVGTYDLYHYCPCKRCTGDGNGITASGTTATRYRTVACKDFEFGTLLFIEGYGFRIVEDRGIGSGKIDIFTDSHQRALEYGVKKNRKVWVVTGVDPEDYF